MATDVFVLKGKPICRNENYILYNCGTYIVRVWTKGLAFHMLRIMQGRICDRAAFLRVLKHERFRHKEIRKLKFRHNEKEILDMMQEKGLVLNGSGDNWDDAIDELLEKASFHPIMRLESSDEEIVRADEEYFYALLHQDKLTPLAKDLLKYISDKELFLRSYDPHIVHNPEIAHKTYVTLDSLCESKFFQNVDRNDISEAIVELICSHCIVLEDRSPAQYISENLDYLKTFEIFA